jgi:predicted nucleic acid-binding protein
VSLVLDASLTLSWYFEDERTSTGDAVMDRVAIDGAFVPSLWRYEVANGFLKAIRRKRIVAAYRDASLAELRHLPITVDRSGDDMTWTATLALADRFQLSIYDAAYLELAERRVLPLATGDRALGAAAQSLELAVLG